MASAVDRTLLCGGGSNTRVRDSESARGGEELREKHVDGSDTRTVATQTPLLKHSLYVHGIWSTGKSIVITLQAKTTDGQSALRWNTALFGRSVAFLQSVAHARETVRLWLGSFLSFLPSSILIILVEA